jgi:hypothetical protein
MQTPKIKCVKQSWNEVMDAREKGQAVAYWLRHYATSLEVRGSKHTRSINFSICVILPATLGPEPLTETSTGSRKIMFLRGRGLPVRKTDNLTAICEPIV